MSSNPRQMDFFFKAMLSSELRLKDDKESMTLPLCHLGTRKRTTPIKWKHPNEDRWVVVSAPTNISIASIHDLDIIIFCLSNLNEQVDKGVKRPEKTIKTTAYNLLKSIGRGTGGREYLNLKDSLDRLTATTIQTNVRKPKLKQYSIFHWLDSVHINEDTKELYLTLPEFLYNGVVDERSILTVHPDYFNLQSGIAKYLYRIARKSAGKQSKGFEWSMRTLHERSASLSNYSDFAKNTRKVIAKMNKDKSFPEYELIIKAQEKAKGQEMIVMLPKPDTARVS